MNYDKPRQKQDGTWGYTTANDNSDTIYAVGYCAPFIELDENIINKYYASKEQYEEHIKPHREANAAGKYHNGGHSTPEEARECYRQYQLDFKLHFRDEEESPNQLNKCEYPDCNEFTSGYAQIGAWRHITICAKHRNRESVEKIYTVGDSWHS